MSTKTLAPQRRIELKSLTGLRGVAAAGVLACHLEPTVLGLFTLKTNWFTGIIAQGFRGVDLFFILSGFILYYVHSADFEKIETASTMRFALLRICRLYPLNSIVLFFWVIAVLSLPGFAEWHRVEHAYQGHYHIGDFSLSSFFLAATLTQSWLPLKLGTWNEPAWTLSAELLGYTFFPLLARGVWLIKGRSAAVVALASLIAFALAMFVSGHARNNPSGPFGDLRMMSCFLAGIAMCRFRQSVELNPIQRLLLADCGLVIVAVSFSFPSTGVLSVFGFAGLILGLSYQSGLIDKVLASGPVVYIGRISFSLYLSHLLVVELCLFLLHNFVDHGSLVVRLAFIVLVVCLVLGVAALLYRLIEAPFTRIGRRVAFARFPDRKKLGARNPALHV